MEAGQFQDQQVDFAFGELGIQESQNFDSKLRQKKSQYISLKGRKEDFFSAFK